MYRPMMIDRGYFGIGIYNPKIESNMGMLMRSAFAFGADFVFTIGKRYEHEATDTPWTNLHVPTFNYSDIDDFFKHVPTECPVVAVELANNARKLTGYCHLERACYLLGAEDSGIPEDILKRCDHTVIIPHTKMCLNVAMTGNIILWDRISKRAQISPNRENRRKLIKEYKQNEQ